MPCSARPEQAAARAVQFAPLFDDGAIKLTARAVCLKENGYHYRIELCARPLRLPAAVSGNSKIHAMSGTAAGRRRVGAHSSIR